MYDEETLNKWDCVVLKEVFHLYQDRKPERYDIIKGIGENHFIDQLLDDGNAYFFNWKK
jgi:hypothetical protein